SIAVVNAINLDSNACGGVGNLTLIGAASGAGVITANNLDVQGSAAFSLTGATKLTSVTSTLTGAGGTLTLVEADGFSIGAGGVNTQQGIAYTTLFRSSIAVVNAINLDSNACGGVGSLTLFGAASGAGVITANNLD